tara:strand:- start:117 stop:341 length:225 start_codon:yes stop_codon:yes gene_type:complete
MNETSIETRINRLEWSSEQHTQKIKSIDDATHNLKRSIYSIEKSILQIRWFVIGGISILVVMEMGLMEMLTKLL